MDDSELLALLIDLESDRVERKASSSDHEKIAETICAFANDFPGYNRPGIIFIGVTNDASSARGP